MSKYNITITTLGTDGFIDSKNSYAYMRENGDAPNTLNDAKNKARANRRYKLLVTNLLQLANMWIENPTAVGATGDSQGTSFTLSVDVADNRLRTRDELNAGQELIEAAALKRVVARALTGTIGTCTIEIYDPTTFTGRAVDGGAGRTVTVGPSVITDTIPALAASIGAAEAAITVAKV